MPAVPNKMLSGPVSPVGVELGDHQLRMAQLRETPQGPVLTAAAAVAVDAADWDTPTAFGRLVRRIIADAWHRHGFAGRGIRVSLPAAQVRWQTLSLSPKEPLTEAAVVEALGGPSGDETLRFFEASRTASDRRVIVARVRREWLEAILHALDRTSRQPLALTTGVLAAAAAFDRLYRRREDVTACDAVIDLGTHATRMFVLRRGRLLRVEQHEQGGASLDQAAAAALSMSAGEANMLRRRLAEAEHEALGDLTDPARPRAGSLFRREDQRVTDGEGRAGSAMSESMIRAAHCRADGTLIDAATGERVWEASRGIAEGLAAAVAAFCRQDARGLNRDAAPTRLLFIGGEANNRRLCRHIASTVGLPAQVGETVTRLRGANTPAPFHLDRPRPEWTAACGLAMPSAAAASKAA